MIEITYAELSLIADLNQRQNSNGISFGDQTCCDYVDGIFFLDDGRVAVTMFVEPCGNVTKVAKSLQAALEWWCRVFELQPKEWNYIDAGWHLNGRKDNLPDDPKDVWKVPLVITLSEPS